MRPGRQKTWDSNPLWLSKTPVERIPTSTQKKKHHHNQSRSNKQMDLDKILPKAKINIITKPVTCNCTVLSEMFPRHVIKDCYLNYTNLYFFTTKPVTYNYTVSDEMLSNNVIKSNRYLQFSLFTAVFTINKCYVKN